MQEVVFSSVVFSFLFCSENHSIDAVSFIHIVSRAVTVVQYLLTPSPTGSAPFAE